MIGPIKKIFKFIFKEFSWDFKKNTSYEELNVFLKSLNPVITHIPLIRIGKNNDSGYVIPDDFKGIEVCISPGVERDSSFEKQLSLKYGIRSILLDYSVDGPGEECEDFVFYKKFLGYGDERYITLEDLNSQCSAKLEKILQMDIEGEEYEVLLDTSLKTLNEFRILCIEFHELDKLIDRDYFRFIKAIFNKLDQLFYIVHIHPNNISKPITYKDLIIPPTIEFTFIRKDRISKFELREFNEYPLDIDMDNCLNSPTLKIPRCFFN